MNNNRKNEKIIFEHVINLNNNDNRPVYELSFYETYLEYNKVPNRMIINIYDGESGEIDYSNITDLTVDCRQSNIRFVIVKDNGEIKEIETFSFKSLFERTIQGVYNKWLLEEYKKDLKSGIELLGKHLKEIIVKKGS